MEKEAAITALASLASGLRLDIYRLLVRHGPEGVVAGDIGAALQVPPTNLSFHLKALTQSGLLTVTQEGRYQRYRANLAWMQALVDYLTAECCAGHPEQCSELRGPGVVPCATDGCAPARAKRTVAATQASPRQQRMTEK
jgi:DNA-binding transcriptional ArsR family regulator